MALKKNYSIPQTQGRVTQSIDFSGYIYPQIFTSSVGDIGRLSSDIFSTILNSTLKNTGALIGGVTSFSKNISRTIGEKRILGNYETVQKIPGKIDISLSMDKVVFYKNSGLFDTVLSINDSGAIKQTAPMLIVEVLEPPKTDNTDNTETDFKTIMYLDCWFKKEDLSYNLKNDLLVVSKFSIDVARMFSPSDVYYKAGNFGLEYSDRFLGKLGLGNISNKLSGLATKADLNIKF